MSGRKLIPTSFIRTDRHVFMCHFTKGSGRVFSTLNHCNISLSMRSFPSSGWIKRRCIHSGRKECTRRNALIPLMTKVQISLLNYLRALFTIALCHRTWLPWASDGPLRLQETEFLFAGFKYMNEGISSFKVPNAASSDGSFTDWNQHYGFAIFATLASGVMGARNITFFVVLHKFCWSVSKDPNPRYIGQSFTLCIRCIWD